MAASPAQVSVLPAVVTLAPGQSTTVAVHLEGAALLHGSSVVLSFDTTRVLVTAVANGDVYPVGEGIMFNAPSTAVRADSVIVDQAMYSSVAAGDTGTMFTVTFVARTAGSTAVHVRSVRLRDTDLQPMNAEGTDGQIVVAPVIVNMKAFLQGPYSGGVMLTGLNTTGVIPLAQPYSGTPRSYAGPEAVASVPAGIVDWVLVELRTGTASATRVAVRAGFIRSNGAIVDLDGTSALSFPGIDAGSYYVVLRHRNHLAVMSAAAVPLTAASALHDMTTGTGMYYGGEAKQLAPGVYGLWAGDVTGNGAIILAQELTVMRANNLQQRYDRADVTMNGAVVLAQELTVVRANNLRTSKVP